jgi:hypothetical protein
MRVRLQGCFDRLDRQPAGHSEVDVESIAIVKRDDDPFASALNGSDDPSNQMPGEIDSGRLKNIRPLKPHAGDDAAYDPGPERSDDGFNFGQFGHRKQW